MRDNALIGIDFGVSVALTKKPASVVLYQLLGTVSALCPGSSKGLQLDVT